MVPFRGNNPKSLAAFVLVNSTKRLSEMRPVSTPSENNMGIIVSRSDTPARKVVTSSDGSSF